MLMSEFSLLTNSGRKTIQVAPRNLLSPFFRAFIKKVRKSPTCIVFGSRRPKKFAADKSTEHVPVPGFAFSLLFLYL